MSAVASAKKMLERQMSASQGIRRPDRGVRIPAACATEHSLHDTPPDEAATDDGRVSPGVDGGGAALGPVSYTHLTLPTICSV
eukprot:2977533-Prymnesium_polylepis.1